MENVQLTTPKDGVEDEYERVMSAVFEAGASGEDFFWGFCRLRQGAWARRAAGLPAPWTADPVIAAYRFTNLYRETDRGTLFLAEEVLERAASARDAAVLAALYRAFNRPETWAMLAEHYCFGTHGFDLVLDDMAHDQSELYAFFGAHHGGATKLFTGAYMMTSMAKVFHDRHAGALHAMAVDASRNDSLRGATNSLSLVPFLGQFSAFQVAMDLAIPTLANGGRPWLPLPKGGRGAGGLDDWAAVGPGSRAGARIIDPRMPADTMMRYLRENQAERLARFDCPASPRFPAPVVNGAPLPLRVSDVEHSLCEFAKWHRAMGGGQRPKSALAPLGPSAWRPSAPVPPAWGDAYGRAAR